MYSQASLSGALLLLLPSLAMAEDVLPTATVTVTRGDIEIGVADIQTACDENDAAAIELTATGNVSNVGDHDAYAFWRDDDEECINSIPDSDDEDMIKEHTVSAELNSLSVTLEFPEDFGDATFTQWHAIQGIETSACQADSAVASKLRKLCLVIDEEDNFSNENPDGKIDQDQEFYGWVTVQVDTQPPPTPDTPDVQSLDSSLLVETRFSATSGETDDLENWQIRYREKPANDDGLDCHDTSFSSNAPTTATAEGKTLKTTLDGLTNGTTYEVCVRAVDDVGNVGPWSTLASGIPIDECDFIECFPGGAPMGFCSAGATPLAALLCLVWVSWRRRRALGRRVPIACALGVAILTTATPASALEWPTFTTPKQEPRFSVGFRIGPYRPKVGPDKNQNPRLWFDTFFQKGLKNGLFAHGPLLKTIEFEYYLTHFFGRWGLGLSAGHWEIGARALRCFEESGADKVYVDCGSDPNAFHTERGKTKTSLIVVPLGVSGIWRADILSRELDVPLIPYLEAGIDMHLWFYQVGGKTATGTDADGNRGKAEGLSWGWHATVGLAVNLDWLDPSGRGKDDSIIGFVGSHIFIEGTYIGGDNFGVDPNNRLDLTDFTGSIGLTLDFQ